MKRTAKKKRRIWYIVLVVLLVCLAGILSLNYYAKGLVQQEIDRLSARKINGLYSFTIGRTGLNVWSGNLRFFDVVIRTDTAAWAVIRQQWPDSFPPVLEVSARAVQLRHFNWKAYFSTKEVILKTISIDRPVFHLTEQRDTIHRDSVLLHALTGFHRQISPLTTVLKIGHFSINHANVLLNTVEKGDTLKRQFDDAFLSLLDVLIDDKSNETTFCRDIELELAHYESGSNARTHTTSLDHLTLSRSTRKITLQQFSTVPQMSEAAFFKQQTSRKAFLAFTCPNVTIGGFDLDKLLETSYLYADSMVFDQGKLYVASSHFLPLPYRKILPQELAQKARTLFNVPKVIFKDSDIQVMTRVPGADFMLPFKHVYVAAHNLSNDSTLMDDQHPLEISAVARFLNNSPIKMDLNIPLLSHTFNADYTASVRNLPLEALNPVISHKDISIKSGFMFVANISSTIRDGVARGTVKMQYESLELELLKKDEDRPRKLMTKLMELVVKEENVRDNDPKTPFTTGYIYHVRNRQEDFFVFLWHSIQTGFLPTIIPSYTRLKKVIKK